MEKAKAARDAKKTREEVRAILVEARPIAESLRPAVEALHEAIKAVLTAEQRCPRSARHAHTQSPRRLRPVGQRIGPGVNSSPPGSSEASR